MRKFAAVQAQDYPAAKWALAQRTRGATESELDSLVDAGRILRTHVLRPTWHFVLPEDITWLLDLSGPRIKRGMAGRLRQLEIDSDTLQGAMRVFTRALAEGPLTRPELGGRLEAAGISPSGQRLPHLLAVAELDRVLVSGPRRGKQLTYALFEQRVPRPAGREGDEAVAHLASRYFQSHGPAQLTDFAWWSGLTLGEARRGIEAAGLREDRVEGVSYWSADAADPPAPDRPQAHLLPNFDEYLVAYQDRSAPAPDRPVAPGFFALENLLANVVAVDGKVRGTWRRAVGRAGVTVEARLLDRLDPAAITALGEAAAELGSFLQLPARLSVLDG